jgi:DNA polymerase-3 subunit delta
VATPAKTGTRSASSKIPQIPQLPWQEARPAPVVLVSGPEQFLADRAGRMIRDALRADDPALEVHDVDAASYTTGELFTLASPSLFGEPRLIRVSGVERCSDALIEDAKKYLEEPADGTVLLLRHSSGTRGKALLDKVRAGSGDGIEILCAEIKKDADRFTFAQAEFRQLGATISPAALRMLVGAYSGDIGELAGACAQLVSDVGNRIDEREVERATQGRVEAGAFVVADAAIAGRAAEALILLRQARASGIDAIPMLAALNMKVRGMARVYGSQGGARGGNVAKEFGMAPWQVERAMKDSRGWREEDLAHVIIQGAETEWQLKGGSRDPDYSLERYVLLVARRGKPAKD